MLTSFLPIRYSTVEKTNDIRKVYFFKTFSVISTIGLKQSNATLIVAVFCTNPWFFSFVLVIYTSCNSDGIKYCDTAVETQSLYLDHLVVGKHPSFTYRLVSVIYRYDDIVEQGHFNCTLFNNNSVC